MTLSTDEGRRHALRLLAVGLLVAGVTPILGAGLAGRFGLGPIDDAYISLRYATHWAGGQGLCFNPGERVEGYTNFLLVAIEAAAVRLGVDAETAMRTAGWLSLSAIACLLFAGLRTHVLPGRNLAAATLAVAASLNLTLVCWAAAGMESCLYAALLLAALLGVLAQGRGRRTLLAATLLALAALTRPEAVALAPICAWVVYRNSRRPTDALRFGAAFAVLYGTYFVARWAYFGDPLPNTFYAKLDYGNAALLARGLRYVASFLAAEALLVVAALACLTPLVRRRGRPLWIEATLLTVAVQLAVVVYEGGDHFAMFRFMVPVVPLLGLLAVHSIARLCERGDDRQRTAILVAASLVTLVVSDVSVGAAPSRDELGRNQLQRFAIESEYAVEWSAVGRWLRATFPAGTSLGTIAVGAVGYHSGLTIVDPYGVVDPTIAHLETGLGRGYAGHEKFDIDATLARRPGLFLILNRITGRPIAPEELGAMIWGDFNRGLLEHAAFREHYRYRTYRVAPGAFVGLHVRQDHE